MNCAGCHAYDLTGGMGPDLTDNSWQYGGKPGEIFHTIAEGTPRGMPAWKDKLTPDQIWQIVSLYSEQARQLTERRDAQNRNGAGSCCAG